MSRILFFLVDSRIRLAFIFFLNHTATTEIYTLSLHDALPISRSFGYHYALKNKVRVNTVSQSPTRTTAGSGVKGFDGFINYAEKMSPLGNATGEDCAKYLVTLFSDLMKYVTMQNLFHDGGFSSTGVTVDVIEQMEK